MKTVGTFLITIALIVGLVSCVYPPPFPEQYNLTISSTEGGSVTTPGEGTFTYWDMDAVELVAEADEGYQFVEWTGDVRTIGDVNAANTTITMSDDYSITANFALGIALEIWDWYDLDGIRGNLGGSYILMDDLDSTTAGYEELASSRANEGKGWRPIGTYDDQFTGSFDGQGYKIRDLFISRADESGVGLFCDVASDGGIIKYIGVVNVTVTGNSSVGGLVGGNSGTVRNSYSAGSVTGSEYIGGLVGYSTGTVSNSYSRGNVTGTGRSQSLSVGGLVGLNTGTVSNAHSSANVTGTGEQQSLYVGGLVGGNTGTVSNSFWDIETSGRATSAGGTGKTTAEMKSVATFAGWNIMTVANPTTRNPSYIWNIVEGQTYPFLRWEPIS
jgi:hypothetical protein